jgi:S1-C subfamily serine protease
MENSKDRGKASDGDKRRRASGLNGILARIGMGNPLDQALRATVELSASNGIGTGFVVDPGGLVVTARHVVARGGETERNVKVRLFPQTDEEICLEGRVFCSHRRLDFALLWLVGAGPFPAIKVGDPRSLHTARSRLPIPAGVPFLSR